MAQKVTKKEEKIFYQALETSSDLRDSFLQEACGTDQTLYQRLKDLLEVNDQQDGFMQGSIMDSQVTLDPDLKIEQPGTVIGRYKLQEKIGEGGMAVVYMAEQEQPIHRRVALKIIKLGMDTRQVIARFEAERQALAIMDHPNIAKVLDAGATETGRPYFVMELVTGVSITEYCDQNALSTKDRLNLFIQVCNAIQHAHQKGIIHRDIKPSNVMVAQHEGMSVPKVIDFGIAKATNQRLTEKTLFTRYAHIIGTPAYMSPEQAELSEFDIDTRSDIYSLGVLMYELLTGTTPFGEEGLRNVGHLEMQRVIREEEPLKPSTKLSTLGETLTDIAKYHGSTPDLLTKSIRGDLDWIAMKSLEKERDRRYDTVSALAIDIQRHLIDEPVSARAPGTAYLLHKFIRRHRSRVVAALVVSSLVVALVVVLLIRNHEQHQLSVRDERALYQASYAFNKRDLTAALRSVKLVLASKHVGTEARLLYERILAHVHKEVDALTARIEADPVDTDNYFNRARCFDYLDEREKANADMQVYSATLSKRWTGDVRLGTPMNLGPLINTSASEQCPRMRADGLEFCFDREGEAVATLLLARRPTRTHPWESPVELRSARTAIFVPSLTTEDSLELYGHDWSGRFGGKYGSCDLIVRTRKTIQDDFGPPENLGPVVNSTAAEFLAAISPDGLELYFSGYLNLGRPGGCGRADLWVTRRATRHDPWLPPENLGSSINSPSDDSRPSISADGLLLFFDSSRPGGFGNTDLWVTKRATRDSPWQAPANLGPTVNTPVSEIFTQLSADGSTLLYCSKRPGGYGDHDVWQVPITIPGYAIDPNTLTHSSGQLKTSDF